MNFHIFPFKINFPSIILFNCNTFVKSRSILDVGKIIDDLTEYPKQKGDVGILVGIDFEKVFNKINFQFTA